MTELVTKIENISKTLRNWKAVAFVGKMPDGSERAVIDKNVATIQMGTFPTLDVLCSAIEAYKTAHAEYEHMLTQLPPDQRQLIWPNQS